MTYAEEQQWRTLGPEAINAEMERRLAVYLAPQPYVVRQATLSRTEPSGWLIRTLYTASDRKDCLRWTRQRERRRCWIEQAHRPAYVHRRR